MTPISALYKQVLKAKTGAKGLRTSYHHGTACHLYHSQFESD